MKITKEAYENLELICNKYYSQLRVMDDYLLKWNRYTYEEKRLMYEKLLAKTYIKESGQPIDELIIDGEYKGEVMFYFKDAIPFAKAGSFPLDKKIKASLAVDRQMNTLHNYGFCFNDIHLENLLIDKDSGQGHLIDFGTITYIDDNDSFSKYFLRCDRQEFKPSLEVDNYKMLISFWSLIYDINLEKHFEHFGVLDISYLEILFKGTTISSLVNVANKNMLLGCPIPNIADFLPFVSDLERVNYDTHLIKSKVLR